MPVHVPPPDLLVQIKCLSPVETAVVLQNAFDLETLREIDERPQQAIHGLESDPDA
jgi:hypothetical protein